MPARVEADLHHYVSTDTTLFQEGLLRIQLRKFRLEKNLLFFNPYFQQSSMESPLSAPKNLEKIQGS